MSGTDYDFVFKILLIGNSAVGKSSLLLRFAEDIFHQTFLPTIGVDFKIRTIQQAGSVVKLQMWDTAGQQKFRNITSAYYKGAQGVVVVFDVTDRQSFQDVQSWVSESERLVNGNPVRLLLGNKCDLVGERQVGSEQAVGFAQNEGMEYYQTSAKTNHNVETIFKELAGRMKERFATPYINKYKTTSSYLLPIQSKGEGNLKSSCC